ncbi:MULTISPECIES: ParD-like family protein [Microbulbifer]|uniref:ParD-like family protein n=1 Tax=Microbulbifer celer TaxID=435905 RepID=A0ABW3U4U1_9GAMM|nr:MULTISPECIES: ParD-like family protein [Microbulbifer]UFN56722.1 ParD-like family protein [Microbulbifer celer]
MGIVKVSDAVHDEIRQASAAMSRSINAQAEFWIRVGMLAELNPDMTYNQLCKKMLREATPTLDTLIGEPSQ